MGGWVRACAVLCLSCAVFLLSSCAVVVAAVRVGSARAARLYVVAKTHKKHPKQEEAHAEVEHVVEVLVEVAHAQGSVARDGPRSGLQVAIDYLRANRANNSANRARQPRVRTVDE